MKIGKVFDVPNHSGLEHCVEPDEYYCMYTDEAINLITPIAPATLKSCHIKSPKIKDAKTTVG